VKTEGLSIAIRSCSDVRPEQAREARARAWKFIFDTYLKKAARQDNAKTKQKSLNTEEGGPHDLEEDIFVRQKV
jgi:hypothetical protein